jgi:hypothetical protein
VVAIWLSVATILGTVFGVVIGFRAGARWSGGAE